MPDKEIHIYLNVNNKEKLLPIGDTFDKSITKIVNLIIADMQPLEIEDRMLKIMQNEITNKRNSKSILP